MHAYWLPKYSYPCNVYTANRAKHTQFVIYGTVTVIRAVGIQTNENSNDPLSTPWKSIGGTVIGKKESTLAAGDAVSSKTQNNSRSAQGIKLEIRQENDAIITNAS